jgi:hypothetical protein
MLGNFERIAATVAVLASLLASGQEVVKAEPGWRVDAEWNASMALFGGVGANVAVKPPTARQIRFHLGAFALRLPEFALGENQDMGWQVHDRAALLGAQYYFREKRGGFYAGADAVLQQRVFTHRDVEGQASVLQYVVAAVGGYEWFPFENLGLYVTPNLLLAMRVAETGEPRLGDDTFKEKALLVLPGVIAGWEF